MAEVIALCLGLAGIIIAVVSAQMGWALGAFS